MKSLVIVVCLLLITIFASSTTACKLRQSDCVQSVECCSRYCRGGKCINFGDADDDQALAKNPCKGHACPAGQICTLQQVQCFRYPCPPIASCVDRP